MLTKNKISVDQKTARLIKGLKIDTLQGIKDFSTMEIEDNVMEAGVRLTVCVDGFDKDIGDIRIKRCRITDKGLKINFKYLGRADNG
jgi:hypothetical protein